MLARGEYVKSVSHDGRAMDRMGAGRRRNAVSRASMGSGTSRSGRRVPPLRGRFPRQSGVRVDLMQRDTDADFRQFQNGIIARNDFRQPALRPPREDDRGLVGLLQDHVPLDGSGRPVFAVPASPPTRGIRSVSSACEGRRSWPRPYHARRGVLQMFPAGTGGGSRASFSLRYPSNPVCMVALSAGFTLWWVHAFR